MGSAFGHSLRVTTFGESHGGALGAVIEGCPPGISLDLDAIQAALDRRRPGQSKLGTSRQEPDRVEVLSGLFDGRTLGTSLTLVVRNRDADSSSYESLRDTYRPSHADYTTEARYGLRAWAGGGRASARETVARVAAGAVAEQILAHLAARSQRPAPRVVAWVETVETVAAEVDATAVEREDVDRNAVRCPDPDAAVAMEQAILAARREGDTVGGIIRCVARDLPAGLGAPVFDKLEADLAKALLSIPAAKGFESGDAFASTRLRGSANNDRFVPDGQGGVRTATNRSGGIQGGISNGMPIELRVAFKPVATIFQEQDTVNREGEATTVRPRGRHDPCVLPRAVPIVEAMVQLVLADHWLRWRGQVGE